MLSSLFAAAWACGTTQYTSTIGAEVTDIIISADFGVQLSVSIDANDSNLQALVSFHGKSLASSVVGTLQMTAPFHCIFKPLNQQILRPRQTQ